MKNYLLLILILVPVSLFGQLKISQEEVSIKEDFEWFKGNGFTPGGSLEGTIDSDIVSTKSKEGSIVNFGDHVITGEFARGISEGEADLKGGIYAFNTGNNIAFGIKPSATYYSPGLVKIRIQNKIPNSTITSLQIGFDIYFNNTTDEKTELNLYYSTDNNCFYKIEGGCFQTPRSASPGWQKTSFSFILTSDLHGVKMENDAFYYIKWKIDTGNGCVKSDEVAIDNFEIIANPEIIFTEVLQQPVTIDANGDDLVSEKEDEFVEFILGKNAEILNLSGWKIKINGITQHVFPDGSGLISGQGAVVFGGGTPMGDFGGALLQTASTGSLEIPNESFTLTLTDAMDVEKASACIASSLVNEAWHRYPFNSGPFIPHSSINKDNPLTHSPGKKITGGENIYLDDAIVWNNKTNAWVEYSDGDQGTELVNVIINGSYDLSTGNIICDNMTVNGSLNIPPGKYVDMPDLSGNLVNPGIFIVESGGIFLSPGNILGDIIVKRNTPWSDSEGRYSFIGSPIKDFVIGDLGGGYYHRFDEPTNSYIPIESETVMSTGMGYTLANKRELVFSGKPHTGTQLVNISKNTGSENYNLVANPYSAPISYDSFMEQNGPEGSQSVTGTIYLWDDGGSNAGTGSTADFRVITAAGDAGGTTNTGSTYNGNIGTAQAFFVVGDIDNNESGIIFNNNMRQISGNEDEHFFRKAESELSRFKLSIHDGNRFYETLIAFIDDATENYDKKYDGPLFSVSHSAKIYSYINENKFAVQALPSPRGKIEIQLGFDLISGGKYEIKMHSLENVDLLDFYLLDQKTGEMIDLRENNYLYTFNAEQGTNQNRFVLMATNSGIFSLDQSIENQFKSYYANGTLNIFLNDYNGSAKISIYNLNGKAVNIFEGLFSNGILEKRMNSISPKVYILNVELTENRYTAKFVTQ